MSELELNINSGHEERITLFADVMLPVPVPKLFTYRIPFEWNDHVGVGFRVVVQFGKKKVLTGVVAAIHRTPPVEYEAKYILDVLDENPVVNERQLELFPWMADYYLCTQGEVLNAALPSGLKLHSESKIQLNPDFHPEYNDEEFTAREQQLLTALSGKKVLSYSEVADVLHIKTYLPVIKSLIRKGAILIFEELRDKYTPKKEKYVRLRKEYLAEKALEQLMKQLERRPGQLEVLLAYLRDVPVFRDPERNDKGLKQRKILEAGLSPSSLKTLIKNGIFELFEVHIPRYLTGISEMNADFTLSDEQEDTRRSIMEQLERHQTVLLYGVTGSGKTEIYIELIREVLAQGGQVLYLLPEIALTTQIVSRLRQVFSDVLGVYHSRYSDNERVEVWKGLAEGKLSFITGVRSAVFLPFSDLQLIIVDEEHEPSYKQYNPAPRYHARDVAQVLARIHHARVILGSATPALETYYLAKTGKFGLVELSGRYGGANLPEIIFADIRAERKRKTLRADFSSLLFEAMSEALARNEQVIIFQNRRGYAPYIMCEECGWIPKCSSCAVSLTYHLYSNQLRCHYCGHSEQYPTVCPACGASTFRTVGTGTEKLEEDLKLLFPEARVQRMDLDTTRSKYSYQNILSEFENGNIDILVGTQMVSKGLDFDRVRVVGIVDMDRMLHFPDFRATERGFQLAVQVSGRAGRREKRGLVIIQTYNLKQPVFTFISNHDFRGFYHAEIGERKKYRYPPYYRLIKITLKHRARETCTGASAWLGEVLGKRLPPGMVTGPYEPLIGKIRNRYLMELLIRIPRDKMNSQRVKETLYDSMVRMKQQRPYKQVTVVFDVDPM